MDGFWRQHPQVRIHASLASGSVLDLPQLRAREIDLFVGLTQKTEGSDEFDVETLFNDRAVIAVGLSNPLARRRKVHVEELMRYPWLMTGQHSRNYAILVEATRTRGLQMPRIVLDSMSVHMRTRLLATGPYVTMLPESVLRSNAERYSLKMLNVDIPKDPWPVVIATLKNRTLTPLAQKFVDHLRAFVRNCFKLR
jgi:DNA-binding transcriptional LysR family regulator